MNVRRFVGRNAREAMAQARAAWGEQAVVLSNRAIEGGVEIVAMADAQVPAAATGSRRGGRARAAPAPAVPQEMSTVSFEEYVRRRQRDAQAKTAGTTMATSAIAAMADPAEAGETALALPPTVRRIPVEPARFAARALERELAGPTGVRLPEDDEPALPELDLGASRTQQRGAADPAAAMRAFASPSLAPGDELLQEIRALRSSISSQLACISWYEGVRRTPDRVRLLRTLLVNGISGLLARHLLERLPADADAACAHRWVIEALARSVACAQGDAIVQAGGVHAAVGPAGCGKTSTVARLAAAAAAVHGPAAVGLLTLDVPRTAAPELLRAHARPLGIPVHTARDAASLAELLALFERKKLVLIDTPGVGRRDARLAEMLAMLPPARVRRLLVLDAAAQPAVLEHSVQAWGTGPGTRCAITRLDEAVHGGAPLDVAIRHRLLVEGISSGARVPQDWHPASASMLARRALLEPPLSPWSSPDESELGLLLATPERPGRAAEGHGLRADPDAMPLPPAADATGLPVFV